LAGTFFGPAAVLTLRFPPIIAPGESLLDWMVLFENLSAKAVAEDEQFCSLQEKKDASSLTETEPEKERRGQECERYSPIWMSASSTTTPNPCTTHIPPWVRFRCEPSIWVSGRGTVSSNRHRATVVTPRKLLSTMPMMANSHIFREYLGRHLQLFSVDHW